ncbi:MAG: 2Fe-2S iron-sulfur cluster-binding protein [Coriobacteriia bacterium]
MRFEPFGLEACVPHGTTILEAARRAGVTIYAPCGGKGTCGKCAVRIIEGVPGAMRPTIRPVLLPKGMTLSCLAEVGGPLVVRPVNARRGDDPSR